MTNTDFQDLCLFAKAFLSYIDLCMWSLRRPLILLLLQTKDVTSQAGHNQLAYYSLSIINHIKEKIIKHVYYIISKLT